MTSIVSICNLALSNLGKKNISSITEASAEARACKQYYEHVRDVLLQVYPWRFAGKTQSLAQIANDKPGKWRYAYSRPMDCLKVRSIRPQYVENDPCPLSAQDEVTIPYEIEGQAVYANLSPAFLRYTCGIIDPAKYSPLFVEALAWHLSARIAMPLTRDVKVRADAYDTARVMQSDAQVADANEVRETSDHKSELVEERR